VSNIELDLLCNGIDVGEESMGLNFSDDEDGEGFYDFDAWLSDEEEEKMDEEATELFGGVTAGGAGVEEGKMDEAYMAEELDDLWGGIVTWFRLSITAIIQLITVLILK